MLCGIRMNERTGELVFGPRPPLGLLVFDDGATYTVDAEYLVGRMPDVDERVRRQHELDLCSSGEQIRPDGAA